MVDDWREILLSEIVLLDNCVCCGEEWKNKKNTSYKNLGSKSVPFVSNYQLISRFGQQRIKLTFCDLHGNNLRDCTKVTNKGILKIKIVSTGMWRNATSVGVVV